MLELRWNERRSKWRTFLSQWWIYPWGHVVPNDGRYAVRCRCPLAPCSQHYTGALHYSIYFSRPSCLPLHCGWGTCSPRSASSWALSLPQNLLSLLLLKGQRGQREVGLYRLPRYNHTETRKEERKYKCCHNQPILQLKCARWRQSFVLIQGATLHSFQNGGNPSKELIWLDQWKDISVQFFLW